MAVARSKVWIPGEVLTASDLNSEFNNILNNGEDLGWPATKAKDLDGQELILDGDGDTSIHADTDDQIDFRTGGTDRVRITNSGLNVVSGTVQENGVPITGAGNTTRLAGVALFKVQTARVRIEEISALQTLASQTFA